MTWMKDENLRYTYVNESIVRSTGIETSAWLGRTRAEIFGAESADLVRERDREVLMRNEPNEFVDSREVRGEKQFLNTIRFPFTAPDGQRFVGGIAIDITALRETEAQLREATADLERKVRERTAQLQEAKNRAEAGARAKSDFLASMSHELRTPLNGIIGFAEFMIDGKPGPLNVKQKEYLGDVLASGRHLLQLINDLLDLSKVESGKMTLYPEAFRIASAIEEVCAVMKPLAQPKNIAFTTIIEPPLDVVTLDEQKVKQILYNLLSNAVKFSGDGGQVQISAAIRDASQLVLSVSDNGIGIKAEDITRLFIDFEQLDAGIARRHTGTGLGLALTRRLVELQGGAIHAESEFGKGSRFIVVLPLAPKGESS
jgi:PAS domain S-box-containing protein